MYIMSTRMWKFVPEKWAEDGTGTRAKRSGNRSESGVRRMNLFYARLSPMFSLML